MFQLRGLAHALLICLAIALAISSLHADRSNPPATVTWISNSSGFWDEGANWSTGLAPQAGDDVVIDRPGQVTVTIRTDTAAIQTLNAKELVVVQAALTATGDCFFDGGLQLAGTLTGAGAKFLRSAGQWSSGTITGGGLSVGVGQTLTLDTSSHFLSATTLQNQGMVVMAAGSLFFQNNSNVVNAPGALWDVQGDLSFSLCGGGPNTFANAGTLRKSAGAGTLTVGGLITLSNTGTLEIQAGTFAASDAWTTSGLMNVSAGAILNLQSATLQAGTTISGTGTSPRPST